MSWGWWFAVALVWAALITLFVFFIAELRADERADREIREHEQMMAALRTAETPEDDEDRLDGFAW